MTQKKIYSAEARRMRQDGLPAPDMTASAGMSEEQYQGLLGAIDALRNDIAGGLAKPAIDETVMENFRKEVTESVQLRTELEELSRVIIETRREIASLQSVGEAPKIHAMTDQLDAVVGDTEGATNAILEAVEIIEDKNESLELNATDPDQLEITEAISTAVMKIYEACNFQDITGQRISKVVGTLKFVEDRISTMIDILGGEQELGELERIEQALHLDGDVELNGPRPEGHEISQAEIDALFD